MSAREQEIQEFYKSYASDIKSIPDIENELHVTQKSPDEWVKLLEEKSKIFRSLFIKDEEALSKYVYPYLSDPDKMTEEEAKAFFAGNASLINDTHSIDMIMEDDLNKAVLQFQKDHSAPKEDIIRAYMLLEIANGHYLAADKTKLAAQYADFVASQTEVFQDDSNKYTNYQQIRTFVLFSIFNALFFNCDYQHQAYFHDYVELKRQFNLFFERMDAIKPYLNDREKPQAEARINLAYITLVDEYITFEEQRVWNKNGQEFTKEEKEAQKEVLIRCEDFLKGLVDESHVEKCLNEYSHWLFCRHMLKQISLEEYIQKLEGLYAKRITSPDDVSLYSSEQFSYHMVISVDLSFALEKNGKIPQKEKDQKILSYFKESLHYLERIPQAAFNQELMKVTTDYLIDIMPIVPDDGTLVESISKLMFFQQTSTLIHNRMVESISAVLAQGMIEKHPESMLLPDIASSSEEVKAKKKEIIEYIRNAGLLHDTGKAPFWDIINLQRRKITNSEFDVIKRHPTVGHEILSANPALKKYADVAYCHHKWYDGSQGYPFEADNVHSPYRTYIDIVTIADSIDAGTDYLGRNYSIGKTFEVILKELTQQQGTRYNPQIVAMINEEKGIQEKISYLTKEGREKIYGEVYQNYLTNLE
jgi:response regulator RpfG family c-di-GMP phosphodiesterase